MSQETTTERAAKIKFGRMLFVYALNGVIKCFSADEIRPLESAMLDIGWKHTASIDPARWIEAMANGTTDPSNMLDELKNTHKQPAHSGYSASAGWESPETAPKDGTQILGDFGYPWPQVAAWNTHDEKWATANMMAHNYCDKTDIWFETELEAEKQLKHWMPLPSLPNAKVEARRK